MKFLASGEQRMYLLEEPPKNKTIFWKVFPNVVGWEDDSQTRSKPLKKKQITPKIAVSTQIS